jgi:hypothetical protein
VNQTEDQYALECEELRERAKAAEEALAWAGVEFDDERLSYVVLQVERTAWQDAVKRVRGG